VDESTRESLEAMGQSLAAGLSRLVDRYEVVEIPSSGLVFQVRHPMLPRGRILDIFIPARAANDHELGLLDDPTDPDHVPGEEFPSAEDLIYYYILERVDTGDFQGRWSEGPNGHLYATLYDDHFL
jgi:hypothetical protein